MAKLQQPCEEIPTFSLTHQNRSHKYPTPEDSLLSANLGETESVKLI